MTSGVVLLPALALVLTSCATTLTPAPCDSAKHTVRELGAFLVYVGFPASLPGLGLLAVTGTPRTNRPTPCVER